MTSPAIYRLFVYGSLRSGFRSPAYEYISRYFRFAGNGKVRGVLYDLGKFPGAVPTDENRYIIGELYLAKNESEFSWAIGQLDDYEGVVNEGNETPLYRRELTEVFINDEIRPAWIYWYNGEVKGRPVIPSGDLLEYMKTK